MSNKANLLKFENMQTNTLYAITINPNDDYQCWNNIDRIKDFISKTKSTILNINKDTAYLELYLELSPTGRLHYHGYLKLHEKINFYTNMIHKLQHIAHVDIDTLDDSGKWEEYVLKQRELHSYMIKNNIPLPLIIGTDFKKLTKDFFTHYSK